MNLKFLIWTFLFLSVGLIFIFITPGQKVLSYHSPEYKIFGYKEDFYQIPLITFIIIILNQILINGLKLERARKFLNMINFLYASICLIAVINLIYINY